MGNELTTQNQIHMKDVSGKSETMRTALAQAVVTARPETIQKIIDGDVEKGDVIATAVVAGIAAAKKTADLLPLCHPVRIDAVNITVKPAGRQIVIEAAVKGRDRTGFEMEALTSATVAALTIYDMCKPIDPEIVIGEVLLLEKAGGKSGLWRRSS